MMIQMSFSSRIGEMSLAELERYEENLQRFRRMLVDSSAEIDGELKKVCARIDEAYAV